MCYSLGMSTFDILVLLLAFALLGGIALAGVKFAGRRTRQDTAAMYGAFPAGDAWMGSKSRGDADNGSPDGGDGGGPD
jgi:hypothetical protein